MNDDQIKRQECQDIYHELSNSIKELEKLIVTETDTCQYYIKQIQDPMFNSKQVDGSLRKENINEITELYKRKIDLYYKLARVHEMKLFSMKIMNDTRFNEQHKYIKKLLDI